MSVIGVLVVIVGRAGRRRVGVVERRLRRRRGVVVAGVGRGQAEPVMDGGRVGRAEQGVLCGGGGGGLLSRVIQRHELHGTEVRRRRVVPVGQQRRLLRTARLCQLAGKSFNFKTTVNNKQRARQSAPTKPTSRPVHVKRENE